MIAAEDEQKRKMLHAIKSLRARLETIEAARTEPIAIIGMGCRFPGGVDSPARFWELLSQGRDAIGEVPSDRWDVDAYYHPDADQPGKISTRFGGFIDDVWSFDAPHFGISPREAASLDPQQRLLLEVSWHALEHAGLDCESLHGSASGVFLGICTSDHLRLASATSEIDAYLATGNMMSVPAGRLAYFYGFQGPAMVIDTACSSSLVAMHNACAALRNGECTLALAGGVNLLLLPDLNIGLSKARMLAADGRCRTFDAAASGYIRSEGCAVLVLKRLSDAREQGDRILALVRGTAVNQDGRTSGLTAPNGPAQEAVIRKALAVSGLEAEGIDYVEAHGTGTPLGDPIEVTALAAVYGVAHTAERPLLLGSVKTNIGHTEACAGLAGVIKVVLALNAEAIPPHLHLQTPNPYIDWKHSPLKVTSQTTPWHRSERVRRAAVSSFGFSGTNSHAILEEAPARAAVKTYSMPGPAMLALSARSENALRQLAQSHALALNALPEHELSGYCAEVNGGRTALEHRGVLSASDRSGLMSQLQQLGQTGQSSQRGQVREGESARVALLFTGQGSQYFGMGRELYENHASFRAALQQCDQILQAQLGHSLVSILYGDQESTQLHETALAQPLIFAIEYACAQLWRELGVIPSLLLGHSVGEYTAAVLAGVFSLEDGLNLIAARARLMASLPNGGGMLAVRTSVKEIEATLNSFPDLVIAVENGPRDLVISGPLVALDACAQSLRSQGIAGTRLRVSHAFHSAAMDAILPAFAELAGRISYQRPHTTLISARTGQVVDQEVAQADYWVRQLREPVYFVRAAQTLCALGCEVAIECGPQPQLLGLIDADAQIVRLPSMYPKRGDLAVFQDSMGRAWLSGVPVRMRAWYPSPLPRPNAPLYPFQRGVHRLKLKSGAQSAHADSASHPMLGERHHNARKPKEACFDAHIDRNTPAFLGDHHILHTIIVPATAYLDMAVSAARHLLDGLPLMLEDVTFPRALELAEQASCHLQLFAEPAEQMLQFSVSSCEHSDNTNWLQHAEGRMARSTRAPTKLGFSWSDVQARAERRVNAADFYARMAERGYHLGAAFQGVVEVCIDSEQTSAAIVTPPSVAFERQRYALHPVLLDACLQSSVATFFNEKDENFLPFAVERLHFYQPMPESFYCVSRVRQSVGGELRCVDLDIFDAQGAAIAYVEGLFLKRATSASLQTRRTEKGHENLYETHWLAQAAASEQAHSAGGLLILGERETARALIMAARKQGLPCAAQGDLLDTPAPGDLLLGQGSQDQQLAALTADFPLSHLVLIADTQIFDVTPETAANAVTAACQSLLEIVRFLVARSVETLPRLTLITRGAVSCSDGAPNNPSHAAWWPMVRSLQLEHPQLGCRLIDLDPQTDATDTGLLAEILNESDEDHLALRGGQRLVARLRRALRPDGKSGGLSFHSDASYLISGGLGGLGQTLAHFLVAHGARHLVLTSRSGAKPSDEPFLETLRSAGARVDVFPVDVAAEAPMAELFAQLKQNWMPLRGVFHAAGVLHDTLTHQLDRSALEKVLAPKVKGTLLLHQHCLDLELDHFVLFSSIASMLGSPAQLNYAAANGFLDAFAAYRAHLGLAAMAINWGPWSEVGMAAEHVATWSRKGVPALTPQRGLHLFAQLLTAPQTQIGAAHIDWPRYIEHHAASPRYSELVPKQPDVSQNHDFMTELLATPAHRQRALLETYVADFLARILALPPQQGLDPKTGFFELGMDSLSSMELRNGLQKSLGLALPATIAFNYGNLEELCGFIASQILPEAPVAEVEVVEDAQPSLEDLAVDDLAAMLAAELEGLGGAS